MVVALVAVSASAASFTWGSSAKVTFGTTVLNSTSAQATIYLVALGADGAWSFGEEIGSLANITDASVQSTVTKTTGSAAVKGKYTSTYGIDGNAGQSYGVVAVYNDGTDTWFNISSSIYTVPAGTLDNATGLEATFDHSATVNADPVLLGNANVGTGWYKVAAPAVPEPASAMLALAGVAMLIRRRKLASC